MKGTASLVTGGAGFIGSHLVEHLLKNGGTVRVLDDFSSGRRENLAMAPAWAGEGGGRLDLIEGDIRDPATCRRAVAGVEVVYHQAALGSVPRSVDDPVTTEEVNVGGTLQVLLAARDAGVRRVVAASSSSVYGDSPRLPKIEEMACEPLSPYALSKYAAETYCRLFFRLYGLETVALRYFNVFGPRQDPNSQYAAVVPRFLAALRAGQRPVVYGTGEQTRDFTYVENVVDANRTAAEAPREACGLAYNIACGERISLLELLACLERMTGRHAEPEFQPMRAGDVLHSLADTQRAARLLGFRGRIGFEEGLARTVAAETRPVG
jgi:nucleoside-diphosphate-sugar epimerase